MNGKGDKATMKALVGSDVRRFVLIENHKFMRTVSIWGSEIFPITSLIGLRRQAVRTTKIQVRQSWKPPPQIFAMTIRRGAP